MQQFVLQSNSHLEQGEPVYVHTAVVPILGANSVMAAKAGLADAHDLAPFILFWSLVILKRLSKKARLIKFMIGWFHHSMNLFVGGGGGG